MEVNGWGRFPRTTATVFTPVDASSINELLQRQEPDSSFIAHGGGRSYGDSALAPRLISSRFLDSFLQLDSDAGIIRCHSGISLDEMLKVLIPRGWFLPVLPGTRFVTLGGAIAADIHGKNHHLAGSFSQHLIEFSLLTASGDILTCSKTENSELFAATCGGMGLTGIIIDAAIQCEKVSSVLINQRSLVAMNLKECFSLIEENETSTYSVAWLDCLSSGDALGRSVIYLGEHSENTNGSELLHRPCKSISVPFNSPGFLLNTYSMKLFNKAYFKLQSRARNESSLSYDKYFFPLDTIAHWNRFYGSKGFLQYQFVIPTEAALEGIGEVLQAVSAAGKGSFLSVLKKFGEGNSNLLSFPRAGYTLTLDFKWQKSLPALLDCLDEIVLAHGGRHYLAKDARMSESVFKQSYPNWEKFLEIKQRIDPEEVFASLQSTRLGLTAR